MEIDYLEMKMRELEYFHDLKVLPEVWTILRMDGRSFSTYTKYNFKKPFDEKFRDLMVKTTGFLLRELYGLYAYTESDEISILLPKNFNMFSREVEKLASISAGLASSMFSIQAQALQHFDSRVIIAVTQEQVLDYFKWRQLDAARCALNGWCYWTLRKEGKSANKATRIMNKMPRSEKNELLFERGINFNEVPAWQRRGIALYWEEYEKEGYNPVKDETVMATRRRVVEDKELPMKDEYTEFLKGLNIWDCE